MKKVLIFGSSGSIGRNALEVIRKDRANFRVLGLMVNRNIKELLKQVEEFMPAYVCVVDEIQAKKIKEFLPRKIKLLSGAKGAEEFSSLKADISIMGIVGISSLKPLLIAMEHSRRVALASKEALVTAGRLVIRQAKKHKTQIIPVDSEINALFQLFNCVQRSYLKKIYLTASGGPLFNYTRKQIKSVTPEVVLSHPTWRMGKRITVDSATLINKGFEVIESHYLFGMNYDNIDIVVHRESHIHAMLEMKDNNIFCLMYKPTMMIPISFSLYYPHRNFPVEGFNLSFSSLAFSFARVDYSKFPLLKIVVDAAKAADNLIVAVNACDEIAVDYFLKGKIKFYDIQRAIEHIIAKIKRAKVSNLNNIYFWDEWTRAKTKEFLDKRCG